MTWKVRESSFDDERPHLHMHDPKADLHMRVDLRTGDLHIFVGSHIAEYARLYLTIEYKRVFGNQLVLKHATEDLRRTDLVLVDTVLKTLDFDYSRQRLLQSLWGRFERQDQPLQA